MKQEQKKVVSGNGGVAVAIDGSVGVSPEQARKRSIVIRIGKMKTEKASGKVHTTAG